ncbi:cyclic nucleotide-binding domain-containing protein [Poritiphilus flavus]|uniref:Cyclic nucleotide-binding domain-containing protein n=1 Tax=Poritiphilus flavus TaxID=2697053 RepID=A0A6L9EGW7_9FLAO|nr:Crp/Fnr family transcriptional regulator [Poritiphilus flavus]NAS13886.1 hypothetical protein [Poritiphilus flavus]
MIPTAINLAKLSKAPFFSTLSQEQLEQVAQEAQEYSFDAGEIIRSTDETNNPFWILLYGSWSMKRYLNSTQKPVVYETGRLGSWHGGISLIDTIATAEIKATSHSYIMRVPQDLMAKWIRDGFPIQEHLLKGIAFGGKLLLDHFYSKK